MPIINIKTRLGEPSCCCRPRSLVSKYVTKGGTAIFDFDLTEKVYSFEDLYQLTFLFKQNDIIWKFDAFKYADNSDEFSMGEYVTVSDDYSVITLTLPPEITNQFSTTGFEECDEYDLINFEVAIRLEVGVENPDANDPVLIEPQYLIGVKDSLYSNVLSENHF